MLHTIWYETVIAVYLSHSHPDLFLLISIQIYLFIDCLSLSSFFTGSICVELNLGGDGKLRVLLERKIEGTRRRGRHRNTWNRDILKWINKSYEECVRLVREMS